MYTVAIIHMRSFSLCKTNFVNIAVRRTNLEEHDETTEVFQQPEDELPTAVPPKISVEVSQPIIEANPRKILRIYTYT